jgi:hypothetical protein
MSSDEGTQDVKSRAEERKLNREKHKAIQNGTYVPTVLERAKDLLRAMPEPSLEKMIEEEGLKDKLDDDSLKKLKIFL